MSSSTVEINVLEIFNVLKKNLGVIAVVTFIGAVSGLLFSKYAIVPEYEASVNMIVNTRADVTATVTNDNITSAKNLVTTYAIIIKSNVVLNEVIDNLNLDITYKELEKKVKVSALNSTQVMCISVQDEQRDRAGKIIEQIALIAPGVIEEAVEAGSCKVISEVEVGEEPCTPDIKRNVVLCTFLAVVVCIAVIFSKVLFNNYIEDDEDVQKYLGLPVIGVIPEVESVE